MGEKCIYCGKEITKDDDYYCNVFHGVIEYHHVKCFAQVPLDYVPFGNVQDVTGILD